MAFGEIGGETVGLGVKDVIDVALAIEGHIFRAMARHGREAHELEQRAELFRLGMGKFDKFESVRAHRVFVRNDRRLGLAP